MPMTAVPTDVSWTPPASGAFTRTLRFGEWISEPVTPLFESWLLPSLEEGLHAQLREWTGQGAPRPHHVIVNGWYFYSINWLSPTTTLRNLPSMLSHIVRQPRRVAAMIPPTVRHGVPLFEREWREELQPRYRAAVAAAADRVEIEAVTDLPALIDELADGAGEYFASVAALAGAAYKMEMNLAGFYRRHLAPSLGGSHLPLLAGFNHHVNPNAAALASLDWWFVPVYLTAAAEPTEEDHARVVAARESAEAAAFDVLASSPRRLDAFRRLLADTQLLVPLREEQVQEWTLSWPVMRRAVFRIGEELAARGAMARPDDVFFLTRLEALTGLRGERLPPTIDIPARRATREHQIGLVPPLLIGRPNFALRRVWEAFPRLLGAVRSDRAILSGSPASPGRVAARVRVIRGPAQFGELESGEILVCPLTAPAWTPLFTLAAAVVTDVGSAASHASIMAREYGIPAVVGCGDATNRLQTGMCVTVDGSTGNVEPA
jgi:rifampicin phosphotransferase